jgi:hypothetical protein
MQDKYIKFEDILKDTIMCRGDNTADSKAKAEWIEEFAGYAVARLNETFASPWYTMMPLAAKVSVDSIVEDAGKKMCDGWNDRMKIKCKADPIVAEGIMRMSEIFVQNPTYFPDCRVRF